MQAIDAAHAATLAATGALLVDVREPDEFAREHIAGAYPLPTSRLPSTHALPVTGRAAVVFHCRSGMRTRTHADALAALVPAGVPAYLLDGGLDAWKLAGQPTVADAKQPLELMRQVQIAAGSLVLLGTLLGALWSPGWLWLSGVIGAGRVFAGASGRCGMARLLRLMPWNRALRG